MPNNPIGVEIAFKKAVIGNVEADQSHKQPDIGFRQALLEQGSDATARCVSSSSSIREDIMESFLIRPLGRRKSSAIDTVIDFRIDAFIPEIDFRAAIVGIEIDAGLRQRSRTRNSTSARYRPIRC